MTGRARTTGRYWLAFASITVLGVLPLLLVMQRAATSGPLFWQTVTGDEAKDALLGTLRLCVQQTLHQQISRPGALTRIDTR